MTVERDDGRTYAQDSLWTSDVGVCYRWRRLQHRPGMPPPRGWTWTTAGGDQGRRYAASQARMIAYTNKPVGLGFGYSRRGSFTGPSGRFGHVVVPYWSLLAATALPPLLWLGVRTRRALALRRRKRLGLCPSCGYDLRGSPGSGRCSECGEAVPAQAGASAAR